ncbi:MAG: helix-turn-helix transcriptional regulator [Phycisphaerales bacterium]|jgi:ribosome-binding protein aMBF1 (putative translation factor)
MRKTQDTTDAVKILHDRYIGDNKERQESVQRERENLAIAEQIYNLRTEANLSQKDLARMVGTTQSVISRLEDADYDGHSLTMLRRIASALHLRIEVRFVPSDLACTCV